MRKTVYFMPVFLLLAVVSFSGVPFAHAQSLGGWTANGWVTSGSVHDMTGNADLTQGQALVTGHDYNMTLNITVPNTSTSTPQFQVSLNALLQPAKGQALVWALHTSTYPGYDRPSFNPVLKTVTFNYVQGTVRLSAYFQVPVNFTIPVAKYTTPSGNGTITLHLPQSGVIFVSIVPVGSTSAGYFSAPVQDQTIQAYLNQYNQTASLVPSGKIPSVYSSLVTPILNESQVLNKLGLPDQGTTLLGSLIPASFPAPPNSSLQTYLLIGLAVAVVLVVLLGLTIMRSRGRSGYSTSLIGEVQKDLAVLEVTAAKYDRAMADKLKSLRAKLSDTS